MTPWPTFPIRALTPFKQGIGHFRRCGALDDRALAVPRDSLNDVLKSLDIVVHAGGPVQSVDYETPADKAEQLAALPVRLGDRAGLTDLLTGLRGGAVELRLEAELDVIALSRVRGMALADPRAAAGVGFFLDLSRTEAARTTLTVRLAPGPHDLELSYRAPSPTWRVSYRLAGVARGRARLVGWGLFDNTLDEDLEDVDLTLISGRPVSFTYDLATTRVPPRPQVSDDPSALEQMVGDPRVAEAISSISHELRSPLTVIRGYAEVGGPGQVDGRAEGEGAAPDGQLVVGDERADDVKLTLGGEAQSLLDGGEEGLAAVGVVQGVGAVPAAEEVGGRAEQRVGGGVGDQDQSEFC